MANARAKVAGACAMLRPVSSSTQVNSFSFWFTYGRFNDKPRGGKMGHCVYSRNYIVKMFYLLKSTFNNRRIKHFMNTLVLGSEPQDDGLDSCDHWKRVMQGHAGANLVPIVASNRIGKEVIETEHGKSAITFYGNSFIAVMKRAQNVAQAVVRTRSTLSAWSCMGARRRPVGNAPTDDFSETSLIHEKHVRQQATINNPKVVDQAVLNVGIEMIKQALGSGDTNFELTWNRSEPQDDGLDSRDHWKRVMQGHAGANLVKGSLRQNMVKVQSHSTATSRKVMLRVDAKQGAPKDRNPPIELFQHLLYAPHDLFSKICLPLCKYSSVDIYPLKIHLTETMYRMMWEYFFPEEEQDRSLEGLNYFWFKTSKKGSIVNEASASSSHSIKESEGSSRSNPYVVPVTSGSNHSSIHGDTTRGHLRGRMRVIALELGRSSFFDRKCEESVADELVLQRHSSNFAPSKMEYKDTKTSKGLDLG
ncbi:hypothetical protein CTI12_AA042840 [Artemisia annua]|uniref:Uncharacterized protein n=1 Tax=Artemisia annua TaxID=35608 RepID=A0A2U1QDU9_ARTAN|nr:hypothetical protein CTI12_AA042840 [Artemisia annua]